MNKILVANRGEIAVRVLSSAKAAGYETVAVYSEADRNAPHVQLADQAVCIGAAAVGDSYLNAARIIAAAQQTGADAIHPGYGFLSENATFARSCEQAGIIFIGPSASAIELMGSKRLSKIAMIEAGVPCIPGYEGADQSDEALHSAALAIGLPVMLKASAGGGGRGMRLVSDAATLNEHIRSARSEAQNAFGSGELIIEKAVLQPRHIEIQVFGDQHGNVVYLGERDCSVQRRHQKVVEEAPSPFVNDNLRRAMGEAAVAAAKSCGYYGAGTVEFLVDAEQNFYFLEMNTRLQVEHPVTELVTGLDLVALQLQVAQGETLGFTQQDITLQGHAIEVRLYAEDPANNFTPQTGKLLLWQAADQHSINDGIRIDSGIQQGLKVTPHYDPMLAKLIAFGRNREEARRRLLRTLRESHLLGIADNRAFLAAILAHPAFINGEATTAFISEHLSDHASMQPLQPELNDLALAAALIAAPQGFTSSHSAARPLKLKQGETVFTLSIRRDGQQLLVNHNGEECALRLLEKTSDLLRYEIDNVQQSIAWAEDNGQLWLDTPRGNLCFSDVTLVSSRAQSAGSDQVRAAMDGAIVTVLAEAGERVTKGQTLAVLEAMKMEHPLKAGVDGVVQDILVQAGDQVKGRQLLIQLQADESAE